MRRLIWRLVFCLAFAVFTTMTGFTEDSAEARHWTLVNNEPGLLVYVPVESVPETAVGTLGVLRSNPRVVRQLPQFQMARVGADYSAVVGFYLVPDSGTYPVVATESAGHTVRRISMEDRVIGINGEQLSLFAFSISSEIVPVLLDGRFGDWSYTADVARFADHFRPQRIIRTTSSGSSEIELSGSNYVNEVGAHLSVLQARLADETLYVYGRFLRPPQKNHRLLFYGYTDRSGDKPAVTIEVFPGNEAAPVLAWKADETAPSVAGYSVTEGAQAEMYVSFDNLARTLGFAEVADMSFDVATAQTSSDFSEQYFFSTVFVRDLEQ